MDIDELDELLFNFGIGFEMGGRRKLIDKTKAQVLSLIKEELEELYGGGKNEPKCDEDNEEAIIEIWDSAVKNCIEKVTNLLTVEEIW